MESHYDRHPSDCTPVLWATTRRHQVLHSQSFVAVFGQELVLVWTNEFITQTQCTNKQTNRRQTQEMQCTRDISRGSNPRIFPKRNVAPSLATVQCHGYLYCPQHLTRHPEPSTLNNHQCHIFRFIILEFLPELCQGWILSISILPCTTPVVSLLSPSWTPHIVPTNTPDSPDSPATGKVPWVSFSPRRSTLQKQNV